MDDIQRDLTQIRTTMKQMQKDMSTLKKNVSTLRGRQDRFEQLYFIAMAQGFPETCGKK